MADPMTRPVSELFSAIADWAISRGAVNLSEEPGLWKGSTKPAAGIGPFEVCVNAHSEIIEAVPPMHAVISCGWLPIAIVNPFGGEIMASHQDGEDEAGLIAHFKANASPPPFTSGRG